MIDVDAILKAQACDNLPPEVRHDTQLANRASDESETGCEALPLDGTDAGGDQEDAGRAVTPTLKQVMQATLPAHFNQMFEI